MSALLLVGLLFGVAPGASAASARAGAVAARPSVQPAPIDPAALHEILARPQFSARQGTDWALARLAERLWDVIKELLQGRAVRSYSNVARALFLALVALAALTFARKLARSRWGPAQADRPEPERPRTREPTVAEHLARADAALANGELREAVRAQMRALLLALVERGLVDRPGGATNREVARALASRGDVPELARRAADLAGRFDQAIYGPDAPDLDAASRFARDSAELRAQLGSVR